MAKLVEKKPEEVAVKAAEEQIRSMMKETMGKMVPVISPKVAVQRADKEVALRKESLLNHAEGVDHMLPESVKEKEMLKNELQLAYVDNASTILDARERGPKETQELQKVLGRGHQALLEGQTEQAQLHLHLATRYDEAGLELKNKIVEQSKGLAAGTVKPSEVTSSLSSQYTEQLKQEQNMIEDKAAATVAKKITDSLGKEKPGIDRLRNAATAANITEQIRTEEAKLAEDIKEGICASSVREDAMKVMRRSLSALEKGLPSEIATMHIELGKRFRTAEPEMRKHLASLSQSLEKVDIKALETPVVRPDASLRSSIIGAEVAGQSIMEKRAKGTGLLLDMVASYVSLLDQNRGKAWAGSSEMESAISTAAQGKEGRGQFDRGLTRYRFSFVGKQLGAITENWHGKAMLSRKGLIDKVTSEGEGLAAKGDTEGARYMFTLATMYIDSVKRLGLLDKKGRVASMRKEDATHLLGMERAMTAIMKGKDKVAGREVEKAFIESFKASQVSHINREAARLEKLTVRRNVGAETIREALGKAREKAKEGNLKSAFSILQYVKDYYGTAERGKKEGWRYDLVTGKAAAYVPDYVTGRKEMLEAIRKEGDSQTETSSGDAAKGIDSGTGKIANIQMLSSDYRKTMGIYNGKRRMAKGVEVGKVPLGKRVKGKYQASVSAEAVRRYEKENPHDLLIWTGDKTKDRMAKLENKLERLGSAVRRGDAKEYQSLSQAYWKRYALIAARVYRKERIEEARKVLGQCSESLLESFRVYAIEAYGEGDPELGMTRYQEARRNAKVEWETRTDNRGIKIREAVSSEVKTLYNYLLKKYGQKAEHSKIKNLVEYAEQAHTLRPNIHNMEDTEENVPLGGISSLLSKVQTESRDTIAYSHLSSKLLAMREYERKLEGRAASRTRMALTYAKRELEKAKDLIVQEKWTETERFSAAKKSYETAMERMMDAMVLYEAKGAVTLRSFGEVGDLADFENYKKVEMKAFRDILAGKGNRTELETRLRGTRMVEVSIFSIPADAGSQLFADYTSEQAKVRQLVAKASVASVADANKILNQSNALFKEMEKNVEDHRFWTNVGVTVVGIGVSMIPGGQTFGGAIFTTMAADQVITEYKIMGEVSLKTWGIFGFTVLTLGMAGAASMARAEAMADLSLFGQTTRHVESMMSLSKGLSYTLLGTGAGFSGYMGYEANEAFKAGDTRGAIFSLGMMAFPLVHAGYAQVKTARAQQKAYRTTRNDLEGSLMATRRPGEAVRYSLPEQPKIRYTPEQMRTASKIAATAEHIMKFNEPPSGVPKKIVAAAEKLAATKEFTSATEWMGVADRKAQMSHALDAMKKMPEAVKAPAEVVRPPPKEVAAPMRPEALAKLRAAAAKRKAKVVLEVPKVEVEAVAREAAPAAAEAVGEISRRLDISRIYQKEPALRAKNEQAMVDWVESVAKRRKISRTEAIKLVARHEAPLMQVVKGENGLIGMPKSLLRKKVVQPDGRKVRLGDVPKAKIRARIDDTLKTVGSTAGIYEGAVEGQAIKVFKDPHVHKAKPTGKDWVELLGRAQKEHDNLKILSEIKVELPGRGKVPLGPEVHGFVDVDGNVALAMERVGTKKSPALAIDEMTAHQVRRHVRPETYDQLKRMWNKLTAEGYEIGDFQFGVLTADQVVNGVPRKAGDVVFWDAGALAETKVLQARTRKLAKKIGKIEEHRTPTADYQLRRATNQAELIITEDLMFDIGKTGQKTLKMEFQKDAATLNRFLRAAAEEGKISAAEQAVSRMAPEEAAKVRGTLERIEKGKLRVNNILKGKEKIKGSTYDLVKEFIVMGEEGRIPAAERILSRMGSKDAAKVRGVLERVGKASVGMEGQAHPEVRLIKKAEVTAAEVRVAVGAEVTIPARRVAEVPTKAAGVKPGVKRMPPEVTAPREAEIVPTELLDMVREGKSVRDAVDALFEKNPNQARRLERVFDAVMLEGAYQKRFLMATPQERALVLEAMPKVRNVAEAFDAMAQRMAPTTAKEISAYAKNLRSRIKSGELTREEVGLRLSAIETKEHGLGNMMALLIREETPTHVLERLPKKWESARDSIKRVDIITKAREARTPEQVKASEIELIKKVAKTPAEQAKLVKTYGKGGIGGRFDVLESLGIEAFRKEARRATTPDKMNVLDSKTAGFLDMLLRGNLESQISEIIPGFEGTTIKKVGYLGGLRGVYAVEMSNGKKIFVKPEGADAAILGRDVATRRGLFTSEMYPWKYKTDLKIEFKGGEEAVMQDVTIIKDIKNYAGTRATIKRPTGEMMKNRMLLGIDMMGGNQGTEILTNPTPTNPVHEIFFSLMSTQKGRQIGFQAWRAYHEISRRSGLIDRFPRNSAFVISGKKGLTLKKILMDVREKGPGKLIEMIKSKDVEVTFQPIDMDFLAGRVRPAMKERYFTEKGKAITKAEAEARAARGEKTIREETPDFDLSGFNGDFEDATTNGFINRLPDAMKKASILETPSGKKLFEGKVPERKSIAQDMISETAEMGARLAADTEGMNEITRSIIERNEGKPVGAGFDASGSTSPESMRAGDLMAYGGDYAPIADIDGRIIMDSKNMLRLYEKLWTDAAQKDFIGFQNDRIEIGFGLKKPDITVPVVKLSMRP